MSEERDDYSQEPDWKEDDYNKRKVPEERREAEYSFSLEQQPIQTVYSEPIQEAPVLTAEEEKKKRRRKILIIVFAITIPAVLVLTGIGFLIWGLVVGFTNCCNSCSDCFTDCFNCSNDCNSCCEGCNSCSTSCDSCCSSSEATTHILKRNVQNGINLMKWYFYSIIEFLERIFLL